MEQQMLDVKLRTKDDYIILEQEDPGSSEQQRIAVTPDQVEVLIKWLIEARNEFRGDYRLG